MILENTVSRRKNVITIQKNGWGNTDGSVKMVAGFLGFPDGSPP
jgi:hypothetical protein